MARDGRGADRGGSPLVRLRVIATTDLHCHIWPYDYASDRPEPGSGLIDAAATIRRLRDEVPNTLLLDNGDLLQGTALGDRLMHDWDPRAGPHPLVVAMAKLGYDGATIGNHDLNFGLDYLRRVWANAPFPVVSANLVRSGTGATPTEIFPASAICSRELVDEAGKSHRVDIGITGALPEQSANWDRMVLGPDIQSLPAVPEITRAVADLRKRGADIIVALCHSGVGDDNDYPTDNAALAVATIDGVDALVAGHTHGLFPNQMPGTGPPLPGIDATAGLLFGRPSAMPGAYGRHLGVLDLTLARDPHGRWRPVAGTGRLEPVTSAEATADGDMWSTLRPFHDRVLAEARRPLARLDGPVHSRFALIGCDPAGRLLGEHLMDYGRSVLGGFGGTPLPVLAATAPIVAGGQAGPGRYLDLPEGPLMRGSLEDIYPFPNPACLIRVNGADIRDWLETAAALYRTVKPGEAPVPLFEVEDPPYAFDTIWGLDYEIDPTRPPGERITAIRLADGRALAPTDPVAVATNSHRAAGAGGYDAATRGALLDVTRRPLRETFGRWLAARERLHADPTPVWQFASGLGCTAWFPSAPGAERWLTQAPNRRLRDGGPRDDGFRRILIDL